MKLTLKGCFPIILFLLLSINLSAQSAHFQKGISIRNGQAGHFYKMVDWDDSQYQEFAYWTQTSGGAVIEFMNFRVMFPPGYNPAEMTKQYPMIVMLQGKGGSGRSVTGQYQYDPSDPRYDNNDYQLVYAGESHRDAVNRAAPDSRAFPGMVLIPQVSYNGAWDNDDRRMTALFIEYLISQYQVDPFRIYLHGLSNGAKGVWKFSFERPDLIAAMLPTSGVGVDLETMTDTLLTTPIWLFQGGLDHNPTPAAANQWIGKLQEKDGKPRLTFYPTLGHRTWNTAYAEPDFFSWMLDKNKRKIFVFGEPNPRSASIEVPVKMGFSAGFLAYQWTMDGVDIPGATKRYYKATAEGIYRVKFLQRINNLWAESYPTNLTPVDYIHYPDDLVYIPDTNFKTILVSNPAINTNGDSEIQYSEATSFTGQIVADGQQITSLTGIESFTALSDLRIPNNLLTSLNLINNVALVELQCQNNDLIRLDLSTNANLTQLHVFSNELVNLNLQNGNTNKLELFEAKDNHLYCIQVDDVTFAETNFATNVDSGAAFNTTCTFAEAVVNIVDVNFKNALLAIPEINTNGDGDIQVSEAEAAVEIDVVSQNITNLTGIDAFISLTHLNCSSNQLTTLNVRSNPNLIELHCQQNQLNSILFLPRLNILDASFNQLSSFDISTTPLSSLKVDNNQLTHLNLSGSTLSILDAKMNPDLSCIIVDDIAYAEANFATNVDPGVEFSTTCAMQEAVVNIPDIKFKNTLLAITEINTNGDGEIQVSEAEVVDYMDVVSENITNLSGIEAFTSLTQLYCGDNQLTTLDVRSNPNLVELHCQQNQLNSILFLPSLDILEASFNQLSSFDISSTPLRFLQVDNNLLTYLNLKSGTPMTYIDAKVNPGLSCILVDDVAYAETHLVANLDPDVVFSTSCTFTEVVVNIPDPNFKNALLAIPEINTNGDGEIQVSEAEATVHMDVVSKNITNLSGISSFISLTHLYCGSNQLTSLDVRSNPKLVELHCQQNQLSSILFPPSLNILEASFNQLGSFVVSTAQLSSLLVDNNLLINLNLIGSDLSVLKAKMNPDLRCILVDNVAYAEANFAANVDPGVVFSTTCSFVVVNIPDLIFKNALLATPEINTNGDGEIQYLEATTYKGAINVGSKGISNLKGIEAFTALTDLRVLDNHLTSLDVSKNTELVQLHMQKNLVTSLDISGNRKITILRAFDNKLISLNIKNGKNNKFTLFDATNNYLICIQVDDVDDAISNFTSSVDQGVTFNMDYCAPGEIPLALEESSFAGNVYPNPFTGKLTVPLRVAKSRPVILVYDIFGKVYEPGPVTLEDHHAILDLSNLRNGIYILQVDQQTYRIVKE